MNQMNRDVELLLQMLGKMFRTIDRPMLSARATESNLQMRKITLDKPPHMMVH